jgi:hypothetical protein
MKKQATKRAKKQAAPNRTEAASLPSNSTHTLKPDRLADAAVAALKARVEHADTHGGIEIDPTELVGTPEQPTVLAAFTRDEIVAACAFLRRIGAIEGQRRAA